MFGKRFSKLLFSIYLRNILLLIPVLLAWFSLAGRVSADDAEELRRCRLNPVETLDVAVSLDDYGNARFTETLVIDTDAVDGKTISYVLRNGDESAPYDLHVFENGEELSALPSEQDRLADHRGCYRYDTESFYRLSWNNPCSGMCTYELTYVVDDMVKQIDGNLTALEYEGMLVTDLRPLHMSVRIGREGQDLGQLSTYANAYGYRGSKGFVDGSYVAETFVKMRAFDQIRITLIFQEGAFDADVVASSRIDEGAPKTSDEICFDAELEHSADRLPFGRKYASLVTWSRLLCVPALACLLCCLGFHAWAVRRTPDNPDSPSEDAIPSREELLSWRKYLAMVVALSLLTASAMFFGAQYYHVGTAMVVAILPIGVVLFLALTACTGLRLIGVLLRDPNSWRER